MIKGSVWFDFSNYPKNYPLYDNGKKLKPGYFKDEFGGQIILEMVVLTFQILVPSTRNTLPSFEMSIPTFIGGYQHFRYFFNILCFSTNIIDFDIKILNVVNIIEAVTTNLIYILVLTC